MLADHPAEPELRLEQAKAAVNLIAHLGTGEPAAARALYDDLRPLAADHPAEAELQEVVARAEAVFPRR